MNARARSWHCGMGHDKSVGQCAHRPGIRLRWYDVRGTASIIASRAGTARLPPEGVMLAMLLVYDCG